ncbi:MAG: hypothetical protein WC628_04680 [Candidatus Omnitrophota bacterium]
MSQKFKLTKFFLNTVLVILGLLFVAKFSAPRFLRMYIESGIGACKDIPIFCMAPVLEITNPVINRDYLQELVPYKFPRMEISLPKGFNITQERVKRYYYKSRANKWRQSHIYVIYQPPGFFTNLFPEVKKRGIGDNYAFIRNVMYARTDYIQGLMDTFFVIMKGIFTPDVGDQRQAVMAQFNLPGRRAFVNYNLSKKENYFDCNVITDNDSFFKVYIKDQGAKLGLEKVMAIISTAETTK